jgi:hypothetical protein
MPITARDVGGVASLQANLFRPENIPAKSPSVMGDISRYATMAGAYLLAACTEPSEPRPTPPENRPPAFSYYQVVPKPTYTDDNLRLSYFASDPDGDSVSTQTDWYLNGSKVGSLANAVSVPGVMMKEGDSWVAKSTASDGKGGNISAEDSTRVQGVPYAEKSVRLIDLRTKNGMAGVPVVFEHSAKADTAMTGPDGVATFKYDSRKPAPSGMFSIKRAGKYGVLTTGTLAEIPNQIYMIDSTVSGAGVEMLANWAYRSGYDGTGHNTLTGCHASYPIKIFIDIGDGTNQQVLALRQTLRNSLFGPEGWNTRSGKTIYREVNSPGDSYVAFKLSTDGTSNFRIYYNADVFPIGGEISLPLGSDLPAALEETGKFGLCVIKEDLNRSPNHSVTAEALTIQDPADLFYVLMGFDLPNKTDVSIYPATRRGGNVIVTP